MTSGRPSPSPPSGSDGFAEHRDAQQEAHGGIADRQRRLRRVEGARLQRVFQQQVLDGGVRLHPPARRDASRAAQEAPGLALSRSASSSNAYAVAPSEGFLGSEVLAAAAMVQAGGVHPRRGGDRSVGLTSRPCRRRSANRSSWRDLQGRPDGPPCQDPHPSPALRDLPPLREVYDSCDASRLPELERQAQTVSTWRNDIIAPLRHGCCNPVNQRIRDPPGHHPTRLRLP